MTVNLSAMQDALGNRLAGDAVLTAALSANPRRILGAVDPAAAKPYVTIGRDEAINTSTGCVDMRDVYVPIHIFTEETGFAKLKEIEAAIITLLDDAPFAVAGHAMVSCFHSRSRVLADPVDGVRHMLIEFDIVIEAVE